MWVNCGLNVIYTVLLQLIFFNLYVFSRKILIPRFSGLKKKIAYANSGPSGFEKIQEKEDDRLSHFITTLSLAQAQLNRVY